MHIPTYQGLPNLLIVPSHEYIGQKIIFNLHTIDGMTIFLLFLQCEYATETIFRNCY